MTNFIPHIRLACLVLIALATTACSNPDEAAPSDLTSPSFAKGPQSKTLLCHKPDRNPVLTEVADAARKAHLNHGDYIARLVVDPLSDKIGDGVYFARITDAVAAARQVRVERNETEAAACRITIDVSAGTFTGSFDSNAHPSLEKFPIVLDVREITLRGALKLRLDADGRATANAGSPTQVTALIADRPLDFQPVTEAMIVVASRTRGNTVDGVVVEGFDFRSARTDGSSGGVAILSLRANDLAVRGNRFVQGLTTALDLRSSAVTVKGNHLSGAGTNCGFCLAGPGEYRVTDNRIVGGALGGIYVVAAFAHAPFSLGASPVTTIESDLLPLTADVVARIDNNEILDHSQIRVGFGLRVSAVGPGAAAVQQTTNVVVTRNEIDGNRFGVIVDAGISPPGAISGDINMRFQHNVIRQSCQSNLLLAFMRHTGALGITNNTVLHNSTFRIDLSEDLNWADAWYSHPAGFSNKLYVNGKTVSNTTSSNHQYSETMCPGL